MGRSDMVDVIRLTRRGAARLPSADRLAACSADGWFEGYASLFNVADSGRDRVAPGAFRRALARRGAGAIKMLYQHQAAEPIGVWREVYENALGLFVRGRIVTGVRRGREVLALMRAGALDGLSIGFKTLRARQDRASGLRTILEADLWEISVVTFPMLERARVTRIGTAQPDAALDMRAS